jgi:polysaccharide export outer membrane protein
MKKILLLVFVVSMLCSRSAAQTLSRNNLTRSDGNVGDKRQTDPQPEGTEDFVIGPEDVLSVMVWHEPELTNNRVTVRPDGKIGLPLLNDVQASNLTPQQLQEQITEGLKLFIANPQVSVIVQEIHSQIVFITGAIGKAGAYPLGRPMTVMELVVRAGGPSEFAKAEEIQILRKEAGKLRRFRFNYKQFAEGKDYKQDISLRNGDMVIVP